MFTVHLIANESIDFVPAQFTKSDNDVDRVTVYGESSRFRLINFNPFWVWPEREREKDADECGESISNVFLIASARALALKKLISAKRKQKLLQNDLHTFHCWAMEPTAHFHLSYYRVALMPNTVLNPFKFKFNDALDLAWFDLVWWPKFDVAGFVC